MVLGCIPVRVFLVRRFNGGVMITDQRGYAIDEQEWVSERARDLMDSGMNWVSARNQAAREWCNGGHYEE